MNAPTQLTSEKLFNIVWSGCDVLRGTIDPSRYKDYILTMLFLKYISDVWEEHYTTYKKQYPNDDIRIASKMQRERFVLGKVSLTNPKTQTVEESFDASFRSLYERRERGNIGELINETLREIETRNAAKLEGVFRGIDFNSEVELGNTTERNPRIKALLELFNREELNLSPSRVSEDIIGNTYIYLIDRFGADAGKKAGEFYTPISISKLVAQLANPQKGARICDPTCGSAGLLIEAAKVVDCEDYSLYGMELMGSTWALARMNMFLHSTDAARIERCDTIRNPLLIEHNRLMQFDVVVANPPFSLKNWGVEEANTDPFHRFDRGIPPKSYGDWAFVSHMIAVAKPKHGRIAVVIPHGVLFRSGAEGKIREAVLKENLIDAVIGLPANLFPSTSIPVAILIFDKAREKGGVKEKVNDILFIDASAEFIPGKNQNNLSDENISKIVKTYQARKVMERYSAKIPLSQIAENEFNLNISRYVDTYIEAEKEDLPALLAQIETLEKEFAVAQRNVKAILKEILQ